MDFAGKFDRWKSSRHPHTNMAKAALNMMTRTSAQEYAHSSIFMTAVDTGWVSDENPLPSRDPRFTTPIDEIDGAARVLDPVFSYLNAAAASTAETTAASPKPLFGVFLKDYAVTQW